MRTCLRTHPAVRGTLLSLAIGLAVPLASQPARAQALVLSVNGEPITSVDVEQRMKLNRALRKPATREGAIEGMIEDRLKSREATRFGINIKDNEIGEHVQTVARRMKVTPQVLMQNMAKTGASPEHIRNYFKAQFGYAILVRALNRGVEASEIQVRSELAREKGKATITSYTIRQIVFTSNPDDPPSVLEANVKKAQALRSRFNSCESGIAYAKSLPGVAVRTKVTRTSMQLSEGIKEVLDKTPIGHLTEPSRSPNGIELVAVCDRSATKDDEDLRKTISERLLGEHFAKEEAAKYREMRAQAVISRNP